MKIKTAIASTTHIDRHNERMSKASLDSFAKKICEKFLPVLIEHDPDNQIGIMLYGKVVKLKDGEYALYVVLGEFESDKERQNFKNDSPNTLWRKFVPYLAKIKNSPKVAQSDSGVSKKTIHNKKLNVADLLEIHLDSTQIWTNGRVYKIKRLIASTGDLQIHVYPKDHLPAHFHILSKQRGINVRFDMNTLDLINIKAGKIREEDVKKIKNFFETHTDALEKLRSEHKRMSG